MPSPSAHSSGPGRLSLAVTAPIALGSACAIDLWLAPTTPETITLAVVASLAIALGILHGALWEGAFALAARAPARVVGGVWLVLAVGLACKLADALGAFDSLGGRYHWLAVGTLVACGLAGPGLAAILLAFGGARSHPHGWLAPLPPRFRLSAAALLLLLAAVAFTADRVAMVGLYPEAHLALRLSFLWLSGLGLALWVRPRAPIAPRHDVWMATLGISVFACALGLGDRAGAELAVLSLRPWPRLALEAGRALTDVDFDGHSHLLGGGDCAWLDPKINPSAREIPGNGIDDNCLLGDGKREAIKRQRLNPPKAPAPMDVVLITIDSLRRDRLGVYSTACGPEGLDTSPNIDAFAERSLVFDHAYTSGGWTSIAISSLMRGVLARRIQWTRMYETSQYHFVRAGDNTALRPGEVIARMFPMPLRDPHPSIAEWLSQRRMHTLAVVDDGYVDVLAPYVGIAPGFELYRQVDSTPHVKRGDSGTAKLAIDTLAAVPAGEPAFMWVHFFGPHAPSKRHKGTRYDGDGVAQRYEHEIRFTDHHLGRLLAALEKRTRPTAVFITADHGEELFVDGRHHGWSLNEDVMRIPLIARVPGWPSGRSEVPVSLVDVMPTILKLTSTPMPKRLDGKPIDTLLADPKRANKRFIYADTWQYDRGGQLYKSEVAALNAKTKATYEPTQSAWALYNLEREPPLRRLATRRTKSAAIRALAHYVESAEGTTKLRD